MSTRVLSHKARKRLRAKCMEEQGYRCYYCQLPMGEGMVEDLRPTVEHLVPTSKGGTDEASNMVVACMSCNHTRGNQIPVDAWRKAAREYAQVRLRVYIRLARAKAIVDEMQRTETHNSLRYLHKVRRQAAVLARQYIKENRNAALARHWPESQNYPSFRISK